MDKIDSFIQLLVGRKLEYVCCECEILDCGFSGDLILHAMGCTRVIKDDDILITTTDYQNWDGKESTNNDEWYNVDKFKDKIVGGRVLSVNKNKLNDLFVELDNGVRIECLVANAYPHFDGDSEQWVLFEHTGKRDGSGAFLTAYNKELDFKERKTDHE